MNPPGPRILYVEDNPMNWRLVQRLLSQAGYEMHWAEDGLKAHAMALALKPDLILLDINLPGLSGFEMAMKFRSEPALKGAVLVALTARGLKMDRETALVAGCDGFIPKPIDPFLFPEQVASYLAGRRELLDEKRQVDVLRLFNHQLVKQLEDKLQETEAANRRLLDAQVQLEQRQGQVAGLLELMHDLRTRREAAGMEEGVAGRLGRELRLDRIHIYRAHSSGTYFQGKRWRGGRWEEVPALPVDHPALAQSRDRIGGGDQALVDQALRDSEAWAHGLESGWWEPHDACALVVLGNRGGGEGPRGLVSVARGEPRFQAHEVWLAELYAELLQVCLENAELAASLEGANQALGTSYDGLESAHAALREAHLALDSQNSLATVGDLFLKVAPRLAAHVRSLMPGDPGEDAHPEAPRRIEGLIQSLLLRSEKGQETGPERIHLHRFIPRELEFLECAGTLPEGFQVDLDFQAERDELLGLPGDLSLMLEYLLDHALAGQPARVILRTRLLEGSLILETEDDGAPLPAQQLASLFEPIPRLWGPEGQGGRQAGKGLPACAQLLAAYGGRAEAEARSSGSLLRLSFPLD